MKKNEKEPLTVTGSSNRADRWLKTLFPELSRNQIDEAFSSGLVTKPSGGRLRKGDKLASAAELSAEALRKHLDSLRVGNPHLDVDIIQNHPDFLIVDKPAGMAGHPIGLFDNQTITHWAFSRFPNIRLEFPTPQPTITPHRLDTDTSGILVVCKTRASFEQWRGRFQKKELTKEYLAWCWGHPASTSFEITYPIGHASNDKRKMEVVRGDLTVARPIYPAHSQVEIIFQHPERALFLARVRAFTGVTHQVRVHLSAEGFPLVGDKLYDRELLMRPFQQPHHQLRAVTLVVNDEERFEVNADKFQSLFV